MSRLTRSLHPLFYRPHIENGFAVAAGVSLAGLAARDPAGAGGGNRRGDGGALRLHRRPARSL